MRKALLPLGMVVGLLAGPLACGPTPEATPPKSPEPLPPTSKVAAAPADAAFDLTPVSEPRDIVGVMRWKNPSATLGSVASCASVDPRYIEGNGKLVADVVLREVMGGGVDTSQLANVVALDAPIDAVVALDPSSSRPRPPFAAISIGLTSLERARGAVDAGAASEIAPGMWRVGGKDHYGAACVIAAAAGSAPARLICGEREKDLIALGPYLARNAPSMTSPGADMHGELRISPVVARYGSDLKQGIKEGLAFGESQAGLGERTFDDALSVATRALQDELIALVGDADKVSLDIGVDPASCFKVSGEVQLKGTASWLAGTIGDRVDRAGPPPAIFWRAPKDSTTAFYGRGADPARFTGILQTTRSLLDGAMRKFNVGKPADRKALLDLIAMPLGKDTNSVQASGNLGGAATSSKKLPSSQQDVEALVNSFVGWHLIGVDEGPAAHTKMLKGFVDAYNKQAALAVAREKAEARDKTTAKPESELTEKEIAAREKKLPPRSLFTFLLEEGGLEAKSLPTIKAVAAPAALGKGAMDVEIKFSGLPSLQDSGGGPAGTAAGKKKDEMSLSLHILLMAEEKSTWLAFGQNRDELVKRLLVVKSGAPDTGTLAARPGLEPLKNGKLMSGGFFTLSPITKAVEAGVNAVAVVGGPMPAEVIGAMQILHNLPHRGESPIFLTTEAAGGGAPRSTLSFSIPKAAMEDLGAIVVGGLKIATGGGQP